jgi:hypothetical protein
VPVTVTVADALLLARTLAVTLRQRESVAERVGVTYAVGDGHPIGRRFAVPDAQPGRCTGAPEGLVGEGPGLGRADGQPGAVQPGHRVGAAGGRVLQRSRPGAHGRWRHGADDVEFTMNSLTLNGTPTLTVTQGRGSAVTSGSSMQFTGNVVLYATQLSGDLSGVPVTLTPGSPLATVLQLLNSVTPAVPLKLTNVSTRQPYISANSLQIPGLQVNAAG